MNLTRLEVNIQCKCECESEEKEQGYSGRCTSNEQKLQLVERSFDVKILIFFGRIKVLTF